MPTAGPRTLPLAGMLAALAGFAALQAVAWLRAGTFEYPLDDVYIHLAMAENITRGTYGVNPGEPASAASSVLYPFLLTPFPGTDFQRLLPLLWNVVAVAGGGWLWGRIVAEAALRFSFAVAAAVGGPMLLNVSGVGFTGMEAGLHMLASLAVVLGLWRFLTGRGVAAWFIAAAVLAPLLRYEGLALTLAAAGVLAVRGAWRAASAITLGALGAVAAFSLFLVSLGLEPLPGSIVAKTSALDPQSGMAMRLVVGVAINLLKPSGVILAALLLVLVLMVAALPGLRRGPAAWLLAAVGLSAAAHLAFGQIGWMHRYEPYILAALVAAFLLAATGLSGAGATAMRGVAAVAVAAAGAAYMPALWGTYVWNPRAVSLQQAQMARFAQDYLKQPVAVNDVGRVAWGNPRYVFDIWGLASAEARKARFGAGTPADGWAGPVAASHGVRAAMIYDSWFGSAVGADWIRVATLKMVAPRGLLGDWTVAFYATGVESVARICAQLQAFRPTLPADAILELEPDGEMRAGRQAAVASCGDAERKRAGAAIGRGRDVAGGGRKSTAAGLGARALARAGNDSAIPEAQ